MKEVKVVAAIMERSGFYLIGQRKLEKPFGGLWEFPGGKIKRGESPEQALHRELEEEFGIESRVNGFFAEGFYEDECLKIKLLGYMVDYISGRFKLVDHDRIRWARPQKMYRYKFAPANLALLEKLKGR